MILEDFSIYEKAMENEVANGVYQHFCRRIEDLPEGYFRRFGGLNLPECPSGYEWYYYIDKAPLSGCDYYVQLDMANKKVGATKFISVS